MSKYSYAVGFYVISIVACAVEQKKPPADSDRAVAEAYVAAWNRHDTVAIDTLLAPDAIHEDFAANFRGKGPKAVVAFMRGIQSTEPDYKWTVTDGIEDGKFVALEWTWTGTYTGPDPAGKQVTNRRTSGKGASFVEVDDGRIKRFSDYYDLSSFFR